jgi:hypothetical protein
MGMFIHLFKLVNTKIGNPKTFLGLDKVEKAREEGPGGGMMLHAPYQWPEHTSSTSTTTLHPSAKQKDGSLDCRSGVREEMVVYTPMDNVAAGRTGSRSVETSAEACFKRCEQIDECVQINFWTGDGGCHLVGAGATGTSPNPNEQVTAIRKKVGC